MKVNRLIRPPYCGGSFRLRLLVVCFFFLFGVFGGLWLHGSVNEQDDQQLKEYLLQYTQVFAGANIEAMTVLTAFAIYFRYPLAVAACRLVVPGLALSPLVCLLQGAALSFTVCCFTSAAGQAGLTLALAVLGLRYFVTLPCTLYLSASALTLPPSYQTRKEKGKKSIIQKEILLAVLHVSPILLLGIAAEILLVPKLLSLALSRIT